MSQHLIHVCVTDAPAWSQRERGKSKRRRKSKQTRVGGKRGGGEGKGQHSGEMRRRERKGEADKRTDIWLIRLLRKTEPK